MSSDECTFEAVPKTAPEWKQNFNTYLKFLGGNSDSKQLEEFKERLKVKSRPKLSGIAETTLSLHTKSPDARTLRKSQVSFVQTSKVTGTETPEAALFPNELQLLEKRGQPAMVRNATLQY